MRTGESMYEPWLQIAFRGDRRSLAGNLNETLNTAGKATLARRYRQRQPLPGKKQERTTPMA
jgi:hypothetical protein